MADNNNQVFEDDISIKEGGAPGATSGQGKIYVNSTDKNLHYVDENGTDTNLLAGGGGPTGPSNFPWPEYSGNIIGHISAEYLGATIDFIDNDAVAFTPINIVRQQTFTRIGVNVQNAGSGTSSVRMAIYNISSDGTPNNLIHDAGSVILSTIGQTEIIINQQLQGKYYLAVAMTGAGTFAQVNTIDLTQLRGPSYFGFVSLDSAFEFSKYGATTGGNSIVSTGFPLSWSATLTFGLVTVPSTWIRPA